MDLGIKGKRAVVCASSRGLRRGCAEALAEAGCRVVINGRDSEALAQTQKALEARGAEAQEVVADISTRDGQAALMAACPDPDILVNNNGGPPGRNFRGLDREEMMAGLVQNMITPIELIQAVVDGMVARGFGRIVNITSVP